MPSKLKVVIVGASGETGRSIAQALLATPESFDVLAFARLASLEKPELLSLAELGAALQAVDLDGPLDDIANLLTGVDVVISCLTLQSLDQEMKLVSAVKQAGVGRYVPSYFGPVCPPRGVMPLRDTKEQILDHIKKLYVPYTVIDIGWWYQMVTPRSPMEPDPKAFTQPMPIVGYGDVKIGLTDNRDIGRFVARIIADERTLNQSVFAFGDLKTLTEAWTEVDDVFGTTVMKSHVSEQSLLNTISKHQNINLGTPGPKELLAVAMAHYYYSLAVRGDDTPEKAKYLGYLDARQLYPDLQPRSWKEYVEELLAGNVKSPYPGR